MSRDPRKQPQPGDVLRRFGVTRHVTGVMQNQRGTLTHVQFNQDQQTTISAWRSWANQDCEVLG
ncbi:hypothetical protein D3C78_1813540 [compost metagenome]